MNNIDQNGSSFGDQIQEGTRLLHQGKAQEAIPFLKQAVQMQPENVDAVINLSGALILDRQFRQAIAILEPFKDLPSNNAMLWINLGAAYLGNPVLARESDQKSAIEAFERALEIDPLAPSVAYNIGLVYEDRKEFMESVFWFGKAVQANPHDEHAQRKIKRLEGLINSNDDVPGTNG
ncbi:MAG TPA: tetratricopeptide repeat protein [Patescibacteria group bacterium]|jgi:tetratricopeptide (TPR) repeat protein|nr:tetratricopeptide repeat protein [Patescibacteria group bacterium]